MLPATHTPDPTFNTFPCKTGPPKSRKARPVQPGRSDSHATSSSRLPHFCRQRLMVSQGAPQGSDEAICGVLKSPDIWDPSGFSWFEER